jgi:hypothetical protein
LEMDMFDAKNEAANLAQAVEKRLKDFPPK